MTFGIETIINLKKCNSETIKSPILIKSYLSQLVKLIDMKTYGDPIIEHFGKSPEVAGITFLQLIETSLISGHLVNLTQSAYINIFSCKEYQTNDAAQFSMQFFNAQHLSFQVIERD